MRRIILFFIASCLLAFGANAKTKPQRIVVTTDRLTENDMYCAKQLQEMLGKGGLSLYIVSRFDEQPQRGSIYVGDNPYIKTDDLPEGGYAMFGDGNWFVLSGQGDKGTLYAVYDFLEHYCGYRLYTPDALVVPDMHNFTLPSDTTIERPAFAYREVSYYYPNHSQLYADWHRLHTSVDREGLFGYFVHSFKDLIPANVHFDAHPEWFSMRDGKRLRDGQLCLSNPEVFDTLCALLAQVIDIAADRKIWSVSPNDNYNVCQCPECLRSDSLFGGPTGTLLNFINRVARRFPDKTISTLAYQYTRSAPKGLVVKPDSNVNIMFCSIECGREEAIATSPKETSFRKDMEDWKRLTDNIFMWDYVVQFRNYWNPFPNLHVLQPNLRYFRDNGVRMMYEQATGNDNKTSWMELRCYLIAKLMWNPDIDADSVITDFCNGYYGAAGVCIKAVIDTMTAELVKSGNRLDIYGYSVDGIEGYLSSNNMHRYRKLMERAYNATDDTVIRKRLRYFEMALDFATIELATNGELNDLFPYEELPDNVDSLIGMTHQLTRSLNGFGVKQMMEMGISPDLYGQVIGRYLYKTFSYGNAYFRPVELRKQPSKPYTCDGAQSLTDGAGGIMDYRHWWLGFYGDTLDAVISLGYTDTVNSVSMDFYFYPLSWIFLPQSITYYISNDKQHWKQIGKHTPDNPAILATPAIRTFETKLDKPTKAKYLRIVAEPLPEIPAWHRAAGKPAWIFTDEVVVE